MTLYNEAAINQIKDILVQREETVAVAESVTAGHLQAALSMAMDASKFFQGGITAYNLGQKARHLHVDPILAAKVDCVSEQVARTMCTEVSRMFSCNYGLSITGYASIVPECKEDGLYAFCALYYNGKILFTKKLSSKKEKPHEVQIDYTTQVIRHFFTALATIRTK